MITIAISKRLIAEGTKGLRDVYIRGISICSPNDLPNKNTGRKIATGRMVSANLHGNYWLPIKRQEFINSPLEQYEFGYKSAFDVEPTKYERKLFRDLSKHLIRKSNSIFFHLRHSDSFSIHTTYI